MQVAGLAASRSPKTVLKYAVEVVLPRAARILGLLVCALHSYLSLPDISWLSHLALLGWLILCLLYILAAFREFQHLPYHRGLPSYDAEVACILDWWLQACPK